MSHEVRGVQRIELAKRLLIPQAFQITPQGIFVAQANNLTGNAIVTHYTGSGDNWKPAAPPMTFPRTHGWPLHVTQDGKTVGLYIKGAGYYKFDWRPGKRVTLADGHLASKTRIPVLYGLSRVTSFGEDKFYKAHSKRLQFRRASPGWVQGEIVHAGRLLTLIGSPIYGMRFAQREWEVQVRNAETGKAEAPVPVPAEMQEPINGRAEVEGMTAGHVGVAVGFKGNYDYHIYQWNPLSPDVIRKQ